MNFDDFLKQNVGRYLDFDGYYGNQCVDLAQFWNKALGNNKTFSGNAKDIANQTLGFYSWVANSPTNVPGKGDIVIWSGNYNGGPGHIGIATGKGDSNTFECFEQNDPLGSNCHVRLYNYNCVAGWLHREISPTPSGDDVLVNQIKSIIDGSDMPSVKIQKIKGVLKV